MRTNRDDQQMTSGDDLASPNRLRRVKPVEMRRLDIHQDKVGSQRSRQRRVRTGVDGQPAT